ncbi:MAG: CocE/NonD family hydrolase [Chloroflexota bacterium]|nr:MAG: CocE/NonD family hydrolase [Chloroflexota bacterium]
MPEPRPASPPDHAVRSERDVRIVVRDGTELSANLWLPAYASPTAPAPVILEMIPYRKDDWRSNSDEARGRYLAARGYVLCRLDVRGTGRSDGIALDEYTADETRDGYDAVEWLAAQSWSNGNVGMWGISYGGFTSIQVAALRPPHLRAIVPMYATDDRYTDDVHYIGGCVTASELTQYAVSMVASNALPAVPARPGEDWLAAWRERLATTPVWLVPWLRHQRDGAYWRGGSLAPDYARIEAAILMFGGWMDSYVDPVFRMLERCTAPRRAIVGNWSHEYPDDGYPGPNLDWLHEMVRFFDHWLKGEPNGVMGEPALTWFERDFAPPEPFPAAWPGRWRAASTSPPADAGRLRLWLTGDDALDDGLRGRLVMRASQVPRAPAATASVTFPHRATTGTTGGLSWGAGSAPNGLARDIRPDESGVPVYTSAPLEAPVSILGMPALEVAVAASMPVATLVVRLSDVAPDGTSCQVTMGILNLTHRRSHTGPEPLGRGVVETVRVPMRAAGYRFALGHRIRVSVASACWPVIWPSPYPGSITIHSGGETGPTSHLDLPLAPAADDASVPAFHLEAPGLEEVGGGTSDPPAWLITQDVMAGTVTVSTHDGGDVILPDGTRLYSAESHDLTASDADPARARMASRIRYVLERAGHAIDIDVDGDTTSTVDAFELDVRLAVRLDGESFHDSRTTESIPRDLV